MPEPTNREQRRHPERLEELESGVQPMDRPQSSQNDIVKQPPQGAQSTRAKSSGHGKKTADKWNQ